MNAYHIQRRFVGHALSKRHSALATWHASGTGQVVARSGNTRFSSSQVSASAASSGARLESPSWISRLKSHPLAAVGLLGLAGVCYEFIPAKQSCRLRTVANADSQSSESGDQPGSQGSQLGAKVSSDSKVIVEPEEQELVNWSGTHTVRTSRYYQPENIDQLKAIVSQAQEKGQKIRPVGSALSPNALAFSEEGMVNLALMDSILSIDKKSRRVTVQAGARVSQVVEALRPHGLTLQNYASIAEQQIGGFIQVGAHGTGASIPPVDEQVVAIKLITPGAGEVVLSAEEEDSMLFKLARTSLGLFGIVAEVTLQCVEAHSLVEETFVVNRTELRTHHERWLRENKHLRYMWIPHTDAVTVVTCNPATAELTARAKAFVPKYSEAERLQPARDLLKSVPECTLSGNEIDTLSFTSLRDELLAVDPLNTAWVRKVNHAEAAFWRRSEGLRVDSSDKVLGFDCGGQQWVSEVAFPVPPAEDKAVDLDFVESIMKLIDEREIPAPSPIEQRWTAPSSSPMSPACERPELELAPLYSWVGIIMYLPETGSNMSQVSETRAAITSAFKAYKHACETEVWGAARAVEHWAKIEIPESDTELERLQRRTAAKYPTAAFDVIRRHIFDPKGILANKLTDALFADSGANSVGESKD